MGEFFQRKKDGTFAKPNLNAPRESKSRYNTLNVNLFKKFKEKFPDSELEYSDFKRIIETGNMIITEKVIENREGVDLPEMLGHLFIGSCPKKKEQQYDYINSREYNMPVNHKNFESNQYLAKIFYSSFQTNYQFRLRKYWYFSAVRTFKRAVSRAFRQNWNMYIKISPFKKISYQIKQLGVRTIKLEKHERKSGRIDFSDSQHY